MPHSRARVSATRRLSTAALGATGLVGMWTTGSCTLPPNLPAPRCAGRLVAPLPSFAHHGAGRTVQHSPASHGCPPPLLFTFQCRCCPPCARAPGIPTWQVLPARVSAARAWSTKPTPAWAAPPVTRTVRCKRLAATRSRPHWYVFVCQRAWLCSSHVQAMLRHTPTRAPTHAHVPVRTPTSHRAPTGARASGARLAPRSCCTVILCAQEPHPPFSNVKARPALRPRCVVCTAAAGLTQLTGDLALGCAPPSAARARLG